MKRIHDYLNKSIFLIVFLQIYGANNSVYSQSVSTKFATCVQELTALGISADKAADTCLIQGPGSSDTELNQGYFRECLDRTMYLTLNGKKVTAFNGYDAGYGFGRKPSHLSNEEMERVGLRWEWSYQSWIGSQPQVKIPVLEYSVAAQRCRDEMNFANP